MELRAGGQVEPLGLDEARPGLSWRLESTEREVRQSAYRVLVASSAEWLAQDRGDLWDTGRVESDDNLRLLYSGAPLRSAQKVFWKVQVWNEQGQAPVWSTPSTWTTGVMMEKDWAPGTRWISDAALLRWQRTKLGCRSQPGKDAATRKWLLIDLGQSVPINAVKLRSITHTLDQNLGFPLRYQPEVADRADFSDARTVAAPEKEASSWVGLIDLPLENITARFVRFTATQLRVFHGEACLAISQIEVLSGGRNIAPTAEITAGDTLEDEQWSLAAVNDGLGVPGANLRASDTLRLRRVFTVRPGLQRALLFVSGLGQCTLAANGVPVAADRLLTPGWTDYRRTCLYDTHDLTAQLHEGANALGLTLGGGMYNVQTGFNRYVKFVSAYRPPKAFGELRWSTRMARWKSSARTNVGGWHRDRPPTRIFLAVRIMMRAARLPAGPAPIFPTRRGRRQRSPPVRVESCAGRHGLRRRHGAHRSVGCQPQFLPESFHARPDHGVVLRGSRGTRN